ncbi:HAMP domain-containing histidine kinase [Patescibacteria group bacterium]|nr:HAMP domain-containing histidine kinase [Patescibacteria group bacterium]
MKALLSRQLGESATGSHRNLFFKARLKLTALYVLIIAIIVCGFSLFLYHTIIGNFADASEEDFAGNISRQHFVESASDSLQHTLVASDLTIILIAAIVSYLLAGKTLRPVEESHEAQRTFAAQASHELRTPLTIIRNDIEVLLRNVQPSSGQMRTTLVSNLEEVKGMTAMVEDLLALARSEQASEKVAEPFALENVIRKVLDKMQPFAAEKGVTLAVEKLMAGVVQGNEDAITRMLVNIIQNSLEHTETGEVVTINLLHNDSFGKITIVDTGKGIDPRDMPHIFTPFYKGIKTSQQGTGLGLAIVKTIVEQHNGTITVQSEKEKGTRVVITLPLV